MSDYYTRCTVEPFIPASAITDFERKVLEASGFFIEECSGENAGKVYLGTEEYLSTIDSSDLENHDIVIPEGKTAEDVDLEWDVILSTVAERAGIKEIIVEGANTCSKLAPGSHGGFVTLITKEKVLSKNTTMIIDELRAMLRG